MRFQGRVSGCVFLDEAGFSNPPSHRGEFPQDEKNPLKLEVSWGLGLCTPGLELEVWEGLGVFRFWCN